MYRIKRVKVNKVAIKRAVEQVILLIDGKKLSLRKAAAETGIKFPTLQKYLKSKQLNNEEKFKIAPNYKSRLNFIEEEDKSLV